MYFLMGIAGAWKWPNNRPTFLWCSAVMGAFIGRHLWQTRALLRVRPYFSDLRSIEDTPEQPLWAVVWSLATDIGVKPP